MGVVESRPSSVLRVCCWASRQDTWDMLDYRGWGLELLETGSLGQVRCGTNRTRCDLSAVADAVADAVVEDVAEPAELAELP